MNLLLEDWPLDHEGDIVLLVFMIFFFALVIYLFCKDTKGKS